jgi:hypothetical protein
LKTLPPSSVAQALFTKVQQKILGLLLGSPEQSFYQNEIIRFANMGKGSIVRELDNLVKSNIVLKSRRGNQVHYRANKEGIVFHELVSIVSKTLAREKLILEALVDISEYIEQAFIYGEISESHSNPQAVINLLVVSDRLTTGGLSNVLVPLEDILGSPFEFTILKKQQYAERITRREASLSKIMKQPRSWLVKKPVK